MIVNRPSLTSLTKRGPFLCWNGWILGFSEEAGGDISGLMERGGSGHGVYIRVKWRHAGARLRSIGLGDGKVCLKPRDTLPV